MVDLTGSESVEELLAEWADILRHKHLFRKCRWARFTVTYANSEVDLKKDPVTYGTQSSDAEIIRTIGEMFKRDIDARLSELEAALKTHGVTVQRPV
jgi:hypothetical protein